jgi:transcriptional regulator
MYLPNHFSDDDPQRLADFIDDNSFGALLTVDEGRPFASHIPFIYDRDPGILLGHVARANPQWRHFANGSGVMVIFQGPHAYISPSWYLTPGVPTWNYAVAHVYGSAQAVHEPEKIAHIIERLTEIHERTHDSPWRPTYDPRMLGAIVGIEIRVREIQGKFKLSQNRSAADEAAVISRLESSGNENSAAVARLMKRK